MRAATEAELARWDELILANPGGPEILQSRAWAEFMGRQGWSPHYMVFEELKLAAVFFSRRAGVFGEVWYCPKGPGVATGEQMRAVAEALQAVLACLIKTEPELPAGEAIPGWVRAPFDIHSSQATFVVDLALDEAALLASFKPKTRYNIRLAARQGVVVSPEPASDQTCQALYDLMMATQSRAGFAARGRNYYFDYWKAEAEAGQGFIWLARHQGSPLAGAFIQTLGARAWYKDGGSRREAGQLQAPYALQWEIMRTLKQRGITAYDLVGVPRPGDTSSSLAGLSQFKAGFNGEFREFAGTYDLPLAPSRYWWWRRVGERACLQYFRRVKRQLWY